MFFCDICKIFKSTFFEEPLRVTTSASSSRYLKTHQNDIFVFCNNSGSPHPKLPHKILEIFKLVVGSVRVIPLSLGFTVILVRAKAVVCSCSSKQVFLKTGLQTFKKKIPIQVFYCEICKVFKNIFLKEYVQWLLLL